MVIQGNFGRLIFSRDNKLGAGSSAVVYRGTFAPFGEKALLCAVKEFKDPYAFASEVRVYEKLQKEGVHPHIVQLFDHSIDSSHWIAMSLFGTKTLYGLTYEKGRRPMWAIGKITGQLVDAVAFLNGKQKIFHGDLKSENVLVNGNYDIKVADFSNSRDLVAKGLATRRTCALYYAAPKSFLGRPHGNTEDMWSVAVIVYKLTTKCYFVNTDPSINKRIQEIDTQIAKLREQGHPEKIPALSYQRGRVDMVFDDVGRTEVLAAQRVRIGEEAPEEWTESFLYPKDRPRLTKTDWQAYLAQGYQALEPRQKLSSADRDIIQSIGKMFDQAVRWEPESAEKVHATMYEELKSRAAEPKIYAIEGEAINPVAVKNNTEMLSTVLLGFNMVALMYTLISISIKLL